MGVIGSTGKAKPAASSPPSCTPPRSAACPCRWCCDGSPTPRAPHRDVLRLLRRSPSAASYVPDAEQFLTTNDKTRSSITSTIMPCLGWLASPTACAATTGATALDVAELIRSHATVYLLGAEESQVAPLVAALTGHIARQARRLAARAPSGGWTHRCGWCWMRPR